MKNYLLIVTAVFLLAGCGSDGVDEPSVDGGEWLINAAQVFDGGPGKDGIPSVDSPNFSSVADVDFLVANDLVVGVVHNGVARAYPHPILDWHEIVNDDIGDLSVAVTYCPLTGTAIGWDRNLGSTNTTFGVSGKLFNTNLIPFDRDTDSYWTQIGLECVTGNRIGEKVTTIPVLETTWQTWRTAYPDSEVLNTDTGFSRNYQSFPYGDYRTNDNNIIFPVTNLDSRIPAKERVLATIDGTTAKAYSIELFEDNRVIEDNFGGQDIMVIGSRDDNYVVAYNNPGGDFTAVTDQLPIIAIDVDGNTLTLDGRVSTGESLTQVNSFMAYFFSLPSFYTTDIYED